MDAKNFIIAVTASYLLSIWGSKKILELPRCGRLIGVLTSTFFSFAGVSLILFLGCRFYYSRPFLAWSFFVSVLWIYVGCRLFFSFEQTVYGFLPGSVISELEREWRPNFVELDSVTSDVAFDVLVVPPTMRNMPREWVAYATNRTIRGVPITQPAFLYEFFTGRVTVESITDEPIFVFRPPLAYLPFKRMTDWVILTAALPFALLLMSILIAVASFRPPIFFTQERMGKNGVPFRMYKFRTMTEDGEVTPLGELLRKRHLDELPQLLNVIKGEMSFIGPRPEVTELAERYSRDIPFYDYRTSMLPGITGWAQVNYGYASVTSENKIKLSYDLYYIKHASFALDALILLKTFNVLLTGFTAK